MFIKKLFVIDFKELKNFILIFDKADIFYYEGRKLYLRENKRIIVRFYLEDIN